MYNLRYCYFYSLFIYFSLTKEITNFIKASDFSINILNENFHMCHSEYR